MVLVNKNKVKLEQNDNKSKELDTSSNKIIDIVSNLKQSMFHQVILKHIRNHQI